MWICSQIGAREHYAIPRALHKTGRLDTLYTDFWAGSALRSVLEQSRKLKLESRNGMGMGALRALAARYHPELAKSEILKADSEEREVSGQWSVVSSQSPLVQSWNVRALWWETLLRRQQKSGKQKAEIGGRKTVVSSRNTSTGFQPPSPQSGEGIAEIGGQRTVVSSQQSVVRGQWSSGSGLYPAFIEVGKRFAIRVRESLKRRTDLKPGSIFFAYDTGALETMEWCKERGIKCVLNQMDPSRVEVDLVRSEEKQWPGWALEVIQVPEAYFARREKEWALADRVVVNSEFSRQALLQQGVPPEKLVVVPLCYEADKETTRPRDHGTTGPRDCGTTGLRDQKSVVSGQWSVVGSQKSELSTLNSQLSTEPLRVLFLGQVILRKGIQYLLAAAKLLVKENIRFDVVGPIGISPKAMATAPGNVTFHGRTSRDQAADWYRRSHLFVLPTLSDGFAITQLEAMAYGLPVIATPCCGEVVSDGVDGFVVPARDAGALAQTFQRYLAQPEMREAHGRAAQVKAGLFTMERLAEKLTRLEEEMTNTKQK